MSVLDGAAIQVMQGSTLVTTLITDSTGLATCNLNAGTYQITISKTGYVTTSYEIIVSADNTIVNFNLPAQPLRSTPSIIVEQLTEVMTIVVNVPSLQESITEVLAANTSTTSSETITETMVAVAIPSSWQLLAYPMYDDPTMPNGTVSPSGYLGETKGVTITATTQQYCLFNYAIADGINVIPSAGTNEAPGTTHAYNYPNQLLGTIHQYQVKFRAAWELISSASGGGTVSPAGTQEVADGSGMGVSATPNASVPQGDGHTLVYYLDHWTLDGQVWPSGSAGPFPKGTTHYLVADFGSYYSPPY